MKQPVVPLRLLMLPFSHRTKGQRISGPSGADRFIDRVTAIGKALVCLGTEDRDSRDTNANNQCQHYGVFNRGYSLLREQQSRYSGCPISDDVIFHDPAPWCIHARDANKSVACVAKQVFLPASVTRLPGANQTELSLEIQGVYLEMIDKLHLNKRGQ